MSIYFRHSGAGQNPAVLSNMPLYFRPRDAGKFLYQLDSGLRRNDELLKAF